MRTLISCISLLAFLLVAACAQGAGVNADSTCKVLSPPREAGEGRVHAQLFKVFPRKSAIGGNFNGCQNIWLYPPGEAGARSAPSDVMRFYFREGKVVAAQIEGQLCEYEADSTPSKLHGAKCPRLAPEAIPSQPAGCVLTLPGSSSPDECDDDA
ncbi:MAG: hypothetical protein HGA47_12780 [Zoogloea sp.]|nr:hypothetical protein [Zoogloea sp.]